MGTRVELLAAADAGDLARVRALVGGGADVDACDYSGETALMKAAWGGHLPVVRFLATAGASLDAKDRAMWETALMHAAVGGHVDVVQYLADMGADLGATDRMGGRTALMQAAFEGRIDVVRCLAKCGADLNATDRARQTALLVAAKNNRLDVVECLASLGADVNAVNRKGQTALRVAANRGNYEVQRMLTRFVAITPQQLTTMSRSAAATTSLARASWFIPPFEIELLRFVESGNVGGDFRAKWLDADVVVKLFIAEASHSSFADQVRVWQQLRHPNVVKLYGACDVGLHLRFFVCEFASRGSLAEYAQTSDASDEAVWKLLYEAALGLEYLHERSIVHGGLRCSNILIGDDGHAKLANFELSESMRTVDPTLAHAPVGSVRWQSPERLTGEAPSLASDVYSLGLCILEALTRRVPWADDDDAWVKHYRKNYWDPGDESETNNQPGDIHGDVRRLVWRMCRQNPDQRASLPSVLYELERLVSKESHGSSSYEPEHEPTYAMDEFSGGLLVKAWARVQSLMSESTDSLHQLTFNELVELRRQIKTAPRTRKVLERFHQVLIEFQQILATPTRQGRVMRLSATCATNNSLHAFHRRVHLLWGMVDDSVHEASKRQLRWIKQRSQQIELFVSEVSNRWLLLNELESTEQRQEFLSFLKTEIGVRGANYTLGQVEVMKKAYNDTMKQLNSTEAASTTPRWFIPWYELRLDLWSCVGAGGFGSVYRAKWLDSEVVVKEVNLGDAGEEDTYAAPSYESEEAAQPVVHETSTAKRKRAAALEMFQHEVDIWFGFSHPHVVRLFGACHVGRPFFVCEYASKGTLVSYIRAHPKQVWEKLYEAALGVQYLHARGVIHGDLKGNNIVVGGDDKAKVTDFGLSSAASNDEEASTQISGASHWLAPEICEGGRPTTQSDIFSLGMCIVEAMRVVEAVQYGKDTREFPPLPWGDLDNAAVKVHVKSGTLPMRPESCTDSQWRLVERMSTFRPDKRIKISTVVDELMRLAKASKAAHSGQESTAIIAPKIPVAGPAVVPKMRRLLDRVRSSRRADDARKSILCPIYDILWDRVELVQRHVHDLHDPVPAADLNALLAGALVGTYTLQHVGNSLIQLTETALWAYALHRRLDKFIEETFLPLGSEQDALMFGEWKMKCYELLGVAPATALDDSADDSAVVDDGVEGKTSTALNDSVVVDVTVVKGKTCWRCWCTG